MSAILIIEDNDDLAFGLRRTLEFEGHEVDVAGDGETGMARVGERVPDLVILDVMLPGRSGFEVLRELRGRGVAVPVLMLTARGEESDVITGFDSGADDYVTKPFSTLELTARVRALLRRGRRAQAADPGERPWGFGAVRVDPASRTVKREGEAVPLTPKEFDLLVALHERRGAVASRAELLSEVWDYRNTDVATRTVDIHMAELRRKLEDNPSEPRFLLTVRKAGYRLKS
ncbi:MAG: response regulator transcription factor [Longimicrobiales bacterium]